MEDFLREREEYLRQQEQEALQRKEQKKSEKAPRFTIGNKSYRLDSLAYKSKETRAELLRDWFFERYEDPANSTPYNSAEGGYLYIWGGPYDAVEVLSEEFEPWLPFEVIEEIADELELSHMEWERIPSEEDQHDYYGIYDELMDYQSNYLLAFNTSIANTKSLLEIPVPDHTERHFLGLIHVSIITALETYLLDAFMNTLSSNPLFLSNFVSRSTEFESGKVEKSVLLRGPEHIQLLIEELERNAKKHLKALLWHNLDSVRENYGKAFSIRFPRDNIEELRNAVIIRHHLVHRNGRDTEDAQVDVTRDSIAVLITQVETLILEIEREIDRVTTPAEDPDDVLEF
ncbi:hypothetical protein [Aeromonas enteropelogenes]|uniref:hypothetical protein n=1 Tax=Aeromonas enteropelogenes TaxID=29489 RepID=UPI003B9EF8BB